MKIHTLETSLHLPLPRSEVFGFSEAANLQRITPPELRFRMLADGPVVIQEGSLIDYEFRLRGIPIRWRSLIRDWNPPIQFVDEQVKGPYALWIHTHRFEEHGGGTTITDAVQYAIRWYPLEELAYPLVRRQLKAIFEHRQRAVETILLPGASGPTPAVTLR